RQVEERARQILRSGAAVVRAGDAHLLLGGRVQDELDGVAAGRAPGAADGDQVLSVGRNADRLQHDLLAGRGAGGAAQGRAAHGGQLDGRGQGARGGGGDDDRGRLLAVQGDGETVRVAGGVHGGGRGRVVDQRPGRVQADQRRRVRGGS